MIEILQDQKQLVSANGTELYCEIRGSGPAVLFIVGATGDAGWYGKIADCLAGEFTVITYDRRGNSRSPKPVEWTQTSIQEQADDAAALLTTLGVAPATLFGSSAGGAIALEVVLRYPDLIQGALIHEPAVIPVLGDQAPGVMAQTQSTIETAIAEGGLRRAVEVFVRQAGGDAVYESLDPALRERILNNGETIFGVELEAFGGYRPEDAAVAATECPLQVFLSRESSLPFMAPICHWLAGLVNTEIAMLPGGHGSYWENPEKTASVLRPYLQQITQVV